MYPIVASLMGAKDSWPVDEKKQEQREQLLIEFEQKRLEEYGEDEHEYDSTEIHTARSAKFLLFGAGVVLIFMILFAVRLVFNAPDIRIMDTMKNDYFFTAIALTFTYFVLAFVAMRVTDGPDEEEVNS